MASQNISNRETGFIHAWFPVFPPNKTWWWICQLHTILSKLRIFLQVFLILCRKVKTVFKKDISSLMKALNRSLNKDRWEGEPNREAVQNRVYFYSKLHHAKSSRFPWTLAWHAYQNGTSIWSTLWRLTNIWIDTKKLLCLFHFCNSQIPFQWEWMVTNGHPACPGSQVSATT